MKNLEYTLTVGLFDKLTEKQEIATEAATEMLSSILIDDFEICAFTMIECSGVYKMESTGRIVREPAIRIEIVTDDEIAINDIIAAVKTALNQETVMIKKAIVDVDFI